MAEVELQAVVSVDIEASKKLINKQIKKLSKEVSGLLKDIQLKVGLDDSQLKRETERASRIVQQEAQKKPAKIKTEVDIDLTEERAKFNQIQKVARDTGKTIDQELKGELELDVAQATLVLKQIRKEIRKETDKEQLIRLNIEARNVQSQLTEFRRGLNNLQNTGDRSLSRLQSKFDQVKGSIGGVVGLLQGGLGFAGVTIGLSALQQGFDQVIQRALAFERAFTNVQKTFKGTTEEFNILKDSLIDLSQTELPLPVEELANIASLGSQLGVAGNDLIAFTDTIARIGVSTNVSTEEAATSLARLSNVFQLPISSVGQLGSTLVDLGNNFATTENDIIQFTRFLGPAGKQAGLSAQDILGIGTALSSVGISSEAGGSAISKALNTINVAVATGSADVAKFAEVAGLSADEFGQKREVNAGGAFVDFVEGLGRSGNQATLVIDELIGSDVRLRNALLASAGAGDILRDSLDRANVAYVENTALLDESAQFFSDAKADADRYTNAINAQQAEIGTKLLPVYNLLQRALLAIGSVVSSVVGGIASTIKFFQDGSTAAKVLTIALTSLGAVLAVVSFGPLVAGIGAFISSIPAILAGISALSIGGVGLATAFAPFSLTVLAVAGAIGALTAAYKTNFLGLKDLVSTVTSAISPFVALVGAIVGLTGSQDEATKSSQQLGQEFLNNQKLIDELTRAGGDNKDQIEELQEANKELTEQLGITGGTVGELTQRYFDNTAELANLDKQLANGTITQELYNEKTAQIIQQQEFLRAGLGDVTIAQEELRQAQARYNASSLDTGVSQEELERLRQKAIQAAEAVLSALILQKEAESVQSFGPVVAGPRFFGLSETEKQIENVKKQLETLRNTASEPIRTTTTRSGGGGGGGRSSGKSAETVQREKELEASKRIEEEKQKIAEETAKKKEDLISQERQLLQDLTQFTKDQTKQTFDDTVQEIARLDKAIADYDQKIKALTASIESLDVDADVSIAQRVIELNKLLADQNTTQERRVELQKELALATANTTQEEIDRQQALSEESTTERILRETEEKRASLQAQLDEEIQARDREVQALEDATAKKEAIQKAFFDRYKIDIDDAYDKELNKLEEIKTKLQEVRALRQELSIATGAGGAGVGGGAGGATVNNNPTVNVQATINNDTDIDDLGRRISEQIFNGAKGIL